MATSLPGASTIHSHRSFIALVVATFTATRALAPSQALPTLVSVPVPPALAELEFSVALAPPMVVHPSGCIALFDQDASQVVCIDPVSGAERRFGRNGAGPGEFVSVNGMTPSPSGGLIVYDVLKNLRFTEITRDWKVGRITRTTEQFMRLFRATTDSVLTIGGPKGRDLVAVSLRDGGSVVSFSPAADTALFTGPNPYDFFGFWLVPLHRGGWYVASPYRYVILHEDEHGRVLSRFGRQVEREPLNDREVAAARRVMEKGNPGRNLDAFMERYRKTPKFVIPRQPAEDAQDRLWVVTGRERADSTELDVFDTRGTFLGTMRVPGDVHALAIHDADMYVLVEYIGGARDGAQGVLHYRVR